MLRLYRSNSKPSPSAITTVGYGEITPRSFLGRLVTLPLLVFGLLLIALPSFVLGREFSLVWEKMTKDQVNFLFRHLLSVSRTLTIHPRTDHKTNLTLR